MKEVFELGGEKWSVPFFKAYPLEACVRKLPHIDRDRVHNVWKQINEKSVRTKKKPDPVIESENQGED